VILETRLPLPTPQNTPEPPILTIDHLLFADPTTIDHLSRDLRRLHAGIGPTSGQLSEAPILDHWSWQPLVRPAIGGEVSGHPLLSSGACITSQVYAVDPFGLWARTYSRWYRLGRHAKGEAINHG